MLLSFCLSGLALGKDDGDGEEDAAKAKPALPNFYLDMRTIYSTLPAGSLSIGFSTPPLLSTLANLSSLRTPTSPSSRSISVDLPLTVDVNDQLSVYGGVSGGTSQAGSGPWTDFTIFSFTLGFQADIYQQNGGMFPTITVQSNVSRSIPDAPLASTTYNTILEADYALNTDETRGLLAGMQYARILVDSPLARVSPDIMGYVGGYYQWDNNWKLTGRFGVQSLRRRAASEPDAVSRLHAADRAVRPRPHGRRRQSAVRHHRADRLDAEAVVPAHAANAALRDQELAARLPQAHAGCESRTAAPRSSLPISGLQAPQLVPAFRRRPTSSTLAAPFLISADI